PTHVPRPLNKFMLFRKALIVRDPAALALIPNPSVVTANQQAFSGIVGRLWNGLTREEKDVWAKKAEEGKREHERMWPDYQYKP
ncbi:hypothetical protein BDV98DRAFT_486541, partial [Pterulicium gracile]